jgi:Leucine-rich repeat (LRR) protein
LNKLLRKRQRSYALITINLAACHQKSATPEISQLSNLTWLVLSGNQLSSLPPEISQLSNLTELFLSDNPQLTSPPPEIVEQGTQAILNYLRAKLEAKG